MNKKALLTAEREQELGSIIQETLQAKTKQRDNLSARLNKEPEPHTLTAKDMADIKRYDEACEEFMVYNKGLVVSLANKQARKYNHGMPFEDLKSEAYLGLQKAIDKFDPSRGRKFSTVATMWIDQTVTRAINNTSRMVRMPENRISQLTYISAVAKELKLPFSDPRVLAEVRRTRPNISEEDFKRIMQTSTDPLSLNLKVDTGDGDPSEFQDFGLKEQELSAESSQFKIHYMNSLESAFQSLSEVERDVLAYEFRVTLDDSKVPTKKSILEKHGISGREYHIVKDRAISSIKLLLTA